MPGKLFQRDANGMILDFRGMNTVAQPDRLPEGKVWFAQNLRRYLSGGTIARSRLTPPLIAMDSGGVVHTLRRMNDTTPAGPAAGYVIFSVQGTNLRMGSLGISANLSGKRCSIVPFRPNQSVQPWAYVADDNKMVKVRSDGTTYKTGIEEPQLPPGVAFSGGGGTVVPGINSIQYKYVYRSSATGALSNPSPASTPGANQQTSSTSTDSASSGSASSLFTFDGTQYEFNAGQIRTRGIPAGLTNYIYAHNFGLSVPSGMHIDGIEVDLNWVGQQPGTGILTNIALFYGGNVIGAVKSPNVLNSSPAATDAVYGGAFDTWNAGLTSAMVNDSSFGFGVQITAVVVSGTNRSFVNSMKVTVYYSQQSADIAATPSSDAQVDKIDFYRFGKGLLNYTYIGTGPNSAAAFSDTLDDLVAQANPVMQSDNFEPYPSIDLPRTGVVDASGGTATWVSGDTFNIRWLPGTSVVFGGKAYVLDRRPSSTTSMYVSGLPDGTNLAYEIAEPILAQQPMRSQWGPTDNVGYMFACGDSLRPGTLYFTKGNNPDSAPDTNQIEVTSPSEPLQNGCIVAGLSLVFSTERAWFAMPNFFDAVATVTGVEGSPFTMQLSISDRGLFARAGLCTDGGKNAYFIGKDGIYVSPGGNGSRSITDADLYNLFPHETTVGQAPTIPANVQLGATGNIVYAPDFTNPDAMSLSFANGYLYFDYQDVGGNYRTLVYDVYAQGWSVDVYQFPVVVHANEEGRVEGVLVGCDSSVRELSDAGSETGTAKLLTAAVNGGDNRSLKHWGDNFIEAAIETGKSVTLKLYQSLYRFGINSIPIPSATQDRSPYIIDFDSGAGVYTVDLEASLSWDLSAITKLFTWQPNMIPQPESTKNRPTDLDDGGTQAVKFVQGALITANSFNAPKAIQAQRGDDLQSFTPNESPLTFNGESTKAITFTPPFLAHNMRIVTTDNVPWSLWKVQWIFEPYPEQCIEWQSELVSHGLTGWQHIFMLNIAHISNTDITITLIFDQGPVSNLTLTVPNSGGNFVKTKVVVPYNKFKLVSYRASSSQPFRLFLPQLEAHVKAWGATAGYDIQRPFGGPASQQGGAAV